MSDSTRRAAFIRWFKAELDGNRKRLMQKTGYSKGRITQILDPNEPFGERAARALCRKLHLDDDYFNVPEPTNFPPGTAHEPGAAYSASPPTAMLAELTALWPLLTKEQQTKVLTELRESVAYLKKTYRELRLIGYDRFAPDPKVAHHITPRPVKAELSIVSRQTPKRSRR
jgi:hypothetical protein